MKSKENIEFIRQLPCQVCGKNPPSDPHHYRTRGAGGGDELTNLMALCHPHHVEIHTIGRRTFWGKYGELIQKNRKESGLPEMEVR